MNENDSKFHQKLLILHLEKEEGIRRIMRLKLVVFSQLIIVRGGIPFRGVPFDMSYDNVSSTRHSLA